MKKELIEMISKVFLDLNINISRIDEECTTIMVYKDENTIYKYKVSRLITILKDLGVKVDDINYLTDSVKIDIEKLEQ